jgi:hypothetical protein
MTNPAHFELWRDYMLLYNFVSSLTDPERYGLAVSDEVRREALKLTKPEARQPAKTQPETDRHIELEGNDK